MNLPRRLSGAEKKQFIVQLFSRFSQVQE